MATSDSSGFDIARKHRVEGFVADVLFALRYGKDIPPGPRERAEYATHALASYAAASSSAARPAIPEDVREGVAHEILKNALCGINSRGLPDLENPEKCASAVLSYLTSIGWGPKEGASRRVRHVKRGSTYRVVGEAEAQVSTGSYNLTTYSRQVSDGARLTVYQCEVDGKLWVRFTDEFEDGRFEDVSKEPRHV